ncbi:MAG: hypothetical protein WBK77_04345 [Alphaproteobacteria bacterium]
MHYVNKDGTFPLANLKCFGDTMKKSDHERAETASSHGQQLASRAEKFLRAFLREHLDLNPDAYVAPESWDEDARSSKVLKRGPKKDAPRIREKMAEQGKPIEDIPDATRFTVIFNDAATIHALRRLLPRFDQKNTRLTRDWEDAGVRLVEYEDNFFKPKKHGYRGFDFKFRIGIPNKGWSGICEVIFIHEHMRESYRLSRALYEGIRKIRAAKASGKDISEADSRKIEQDTEILHLLYDRDMQDEEYDLSSLIGNQADIDHFESEINNREGKTTRKPSKSLRGMNTPWEWKAENCEPEI